MVPAFMLNLLIDITLIFMESGLEFHACKLVILLMELMEYDESMACHIDGHIWYG